MTQEQRRQVAILNAKYFTEFGSTPDGRLRFQWMRTDEMFIFFGRGYSNRKDPVTGLYLAGRDYIRRSMAETTNHGACWTIAYLEPPVSRESWLTEHGTDIPWPAQGYYRPIDNITRMLEMIPDEDCSAQAAFNIRNHLEFTFKDWVDFDAANREKKDADYKNRLGDMIDDATPAFNNNPGGKGHVSLPSVQ